MTSRSATAKDYLVGLPEDWEVPDPPPKEPDMQQDIWIFEFRGILRAHLGHRDDVLIAGGGYLRNDPRDDNERFVPDCVVAFGVNPNAIVARNGYVIGHAGKPPDFVLEVASRSTGRRDYTVKRDGYAAYGVREYWRFDHTAGRFHDAPLAGDTLTGEEYTPIPINHDQSGLIWGHSEVLSLDVCWEAGTLRLRDPATGKFLLKPEELQSELEASRARAETAEAQVAALEAELRRLRG